MPQVVDRLMSLSATRLAAWPRTALETTVMTALVDKQRVVQLATTPLWCGSGPQEQDDRPVRSAALLLEHVGKVSRDCARCDDSLTAVLALRRSRTTCGAGCWPTLSSTSSPSTLVRHHLCCGPSYSTSTHVSDGLRRAALLMHRRAGTHPSFCGMRSSLLRIR